MSLRPLFFVTPLWIHRIKALSPESLRAKEQHVKKLVWSLSPAVILESKSRIARIQNPWREVAFEEVMADKGLKTTISRRLGGQKEAEAQWENGKMQCVSQFCV